MNVDRENGPLQNKFSSAQLFKVPVNLQVGTANVSRVMS